MKTSTAFLVLVAALTLATIPILVSAGAAEPSGPSAPAKMYPKFTKTVKTASIHGPTELVHEGDGWGLGNNNENRYPAGEIWIYESDDKSSPWDSVPTDGDVEIRLTIQNPVSSFDPATVYDAFPLSADDDIVIKDGNGTIIVEDGSTGEWVWTLPASTDRGDNETKIYFEAPTESPIVTDDALDFEELALTITSVSDTSPTATSALGTTHLVNRILVEDRN